MATSQAQTNRGQRTSAAPKDARNGAHRDSARPLPPCGGAVTGTALGWYNGLAAEGCGFLEEQYDQRSRL